MDAQERAEKFETIVKKVMSREEAAEYLGVSPATLHNYMAYDPTFPVIRIGKSGKGGRILINRDRLDKWLDEHTAG